MTCRNGLLQLHRLPPLRLFGLDAPVKSIDVSSDRRRVAAVSTRGIVEVHDIVDRVPEWSRALAINPAGRRSRSSEGIGGLPDSHGAFSRRTRPPGVPCMNIPSQAPVARVMALLTHQS